MTDSDDVKTAVNSAWMVVFGSAFPDERHAGGVKDIDDERVIEELVTGVEALQEYAEKEGFEDVLEQEVEKNQFLPHPESAEQEIREMIYEGGEERIDTHVFKKVHHAIADATMPIEDLVLAREDGF